MQSAIARTGTAKKQWKYYLEWKPQKKINRKEYKEVLTCVFVCVVGRCHSHRGGDEMTWGMNENSLSIRAVLLSRWEPLLPEAAPDRLAGCLPTHHSLYSPVLIHPELKARRVVIGWCLKWLNTLYCFINLFQTLPFNSLCKPQFSVCFYWSNIMTSINVVHGFCWTVEWTDWKKGTWRMKKNPL